MNSAQSAFGPHFFFFTRRWLKKEQPIRSWLPHSSLEVPLGISLQSESDRREIKVEVQKSHFSVDAEEIVVSPVTPCGLKHCKRARQSLGNCCSYFGNLDLHHRENNPGSVM